MKISTPPVKVLDFHDGSTTGEALRTFYVTYNRLFKSDPRYVLHVIHGYGSSGVVGKICIKLRTFLDENREYLEYQKGEDIDNNPGYTNIYLRKPLPPISEYLQPKILDFLSKSDEPIIKILDKFYDWPPADIKKAVTALKNRGLIQLRQRGRLDIYHRV
jgi:hypothetical protein